MTYPFILEIQDALFSLTLRQVLTIVSVAAVVLWVGLYYNRMVALTQQCNKAFSDIDAQLKHRHNLIPGLLDTVRSYMGHERNVLDAVVRLRAEAMAGGPPDHTARTEAQLGHSLMQVLALAENYPALQAATGFHDLRMELSDCENRITAARRFFNLAVQEYNTMRDQFPGNIVATVFGMSQRQGYAIGEARAEIDQPLSLKL